MSFAGSRVGKYELRREIGHGGYGRVYVAHDTELERDCALKFLLPEHTQKPEVLKRFLQEARATARIGHPGIVTVYEAAQLDIAGTGSTAFIAMELLRGESLALRLRAGGIPLPLAIEFTRQIAAAVGAAHDAGIVHRDLKPENVFVVDDPAASLGERVKVLDFGIAKLAESPQDSRSTDSLQVFGSPHYMSPEQCRSSAKVDHRSDIYALGVMLFEMLCGQAPFDGTPGELVSLHQVARPPMLRTLRADLPASIELLVDAMLAKQPAERPASMTEVIARLAYVRETSSSAVVRPAATLLEIDERDAPTVTPVRVAAPTILEQPPRSTRRTWMIAGGAALLVTMTIGITLAVTREEVASPPVAPAADAGPRAESATPTTGTPPGRIQVDPPAITDPDAVQAWNDIARNVNAGDFAKARELLDDFEQAYGQTSETRSLATQLDALPPSGERPTRGKKRKSD